MPKTPTLEVKTPRRAPTRAQERAAPEAEGVVASDAENARTSLQPDADDFLDPEARDAHARGDRQDDPRMRPFLAAARSHLDKPSNPKPEWPPVTGLYGTGAISLLARLDEAMELRNRAAALNVDTMHALASVGIYKQAVLAWMDAEGL